LVRTRISIGYVFLFNAGIPYPTIAALLGSGVPLYIDTNHDVGGDTHFMQWPMPTAI
jgi:hypothetical protein